MGIDAIVTIGSLIIPPLFDFIKKKFLRKGTDTPEATMSTLATTKPDVLPQYVSSLAAYYEALTKWFNRDIIGVASTWVVNWRACIRPAVVSAAMLHLVVAHFAGIPVPEGLRYFYEAVIGEWCGERLILDRK